MLTFSGIQSWTGATVGVVLGSILWPIFTGNCLDMNMKQGTRFFAVMVMALVLCLNSAQAQEGIVIPISDGGVVTVDGNAHAKVASGLGRTVIMFWMVRVLMLPSPGGRTDKVMS